MMDIPFIELIQISLGKRDSFSVPKKDLDWSGLFETAKKQAIAGVLFTGVENKGKEYGIPRDILFQWFGVVNRLNGANEVLNERAKDVAKLLEKSDFRCCVLKGQGTALMYPHPEHRQCGDIDIWVDGKRDEILKFIRGIAPIGHIDVKHTDWHVFTDAEVEVHFIPTWFYNPFTNKKLKQWIGLQKKEQFQNMSVLGFNTPTIPFNLVYSLIHIYRHLFDNGIGLRQLLDYYYILLHSSDSERTEAMNVLRSFKMERFAAAVMFVQQKVFNIDQQYLLCQPSSIDGAFLFDEIMQAGNFGQYDNRLAKVNKGRFTRGLFNLKRNIKFIRSYHQEVLWEPFWKIWHYCWRKYKGYL